MMPSSRPPSGSRFGRKTETGRHAPSKPQVESRAKAEHAPSEADQPPVERKRSRVGKPASSVRKAAARHSGRTAERFPIYDYTVSVTKAGPRWLPKKKKNLAVRVVNMSAAGAQVESVEELPVGEKIVFSLHLTKFADTLEAEGMVVRVWKSSNLDGQTWYAGIKFGEMGPAQKKLLNYMTSWFTSFQSRVRKS